MSRILFAWEMGNHLGHLSKMFPLVRRLKARGHTIIAVVRDVRLASTALAPAGIDFVQAPILPMERVARLLSSYAEMLQVQGWDDGAKLEGLVRSWVTLMRLFSPDLVVADHSPTALLAARVVGVRCTVIATGFEYPPATEPLPPFPRVAEATVEAATEVEAQVLRNANEVLQRLAARPLTALRDVFEVERCWLTTFPELDHYGDRAEGRYVGPIGEVEDAEHIEWPSGDRKRVFAYFRRGTPALSHLLQVLSSCSADVICYGPDLDATLTEKLCRPGFIVTRRPVNLSTLLPHANACISYSPAGTVTTSLLQGVPQLLAPAHIEAQLTAHRVESMGAGLILRGPQDERSITVSLKYLLQRPEFSERAQRFARRYQDFNPVSAADAVANEVESIAARTSPLAGCVAGV